MTDLRKCCGTPKGAGVHANGCQQAFAEQHIPARQPADGTRKCCGTPRGHVNPHKEGCPSDPRRVIPPRQLIKAIGREVEPDWSLTCTVCGQSPVLPLTGMCGPCTFGEAETVGGNW